MAMRKICKAIKKNGKRCSYTAKYTGYCGIHKSLANMEIDSNRDTRLTAILTTGATLILIVEKAIQYLPETVAIVTDLTKYMNFKMEYDSFGNPITETWAYHDGPNTRKKSAKKELSELITAVNRSDKRYFERFSKKELFNELITDTHIPNKLREELASLIKKMEYEIKN